jgi:hypothetical protein
MSDDRLLSLGLTAQDLVLLRAARQARQIEATAAPSVVGEIAGALLKETNRARDP